MSQANSDTNLIKRFSYVIDGVNTDFSWSHDRWISDDKNFEIRPTHDRTGPNFSSLEISLDTWNAFYLDTHVDWQAI